MTEQIHLRSELIIFVGAGGWFEQHPESLLRTQVAAILTWPGDPDAKRLELTVRSFPMNLAKSRRAYSCGFALLVDLAQSCLRTEAAMTGVGRHVRLFCGASC